MLAAVALALAGLAAEAARTRVRLARLRAVVRLIDEENAKDPRLPPMELEYGQRMSVTLDRFYGSSAAPPLMVQIACRGQHVCRWEIPRTDFPTGTAGYLAWRKALQALHAQRVESLMRRVGYGDDECARVRSMITKQDLKVDAWAQLVEDVAALNFLAHYFPAFHDKQQDNLGKIVSIVAKTWRKMSPDARAFALGLQLPPEQADVVRLALDVVAAQRSSEDANDDDD